MKQIAKSCKSYFLIVIFWMGFLAMLNLRKLKQDFSSNVLKEGKDIFEQKKVLSAKIIHFDTESLRINAKILGQYNNTYESEIEIDRIECETVDSDCDCPYHYDCQHLAALLFFLEANLDAILVEYSNEANLDGRADIDEEQKDEILDVVKEAANKEEERKVAQYQKELMQEYINASSILAQSPFFVPKQDTKIDNAEMAVIFTITEHQEVSMVEAQIALRLPFRSKPLHLPHAMHFLESLRYEEPLVIGGKKYLFSIESFPKQHSDILRMLLDYAKSHSKINTEKGQKIVHLDLRSFGMILAKAHDIASQRLDQSGIPFDEEDLPTLPCIYEESLESPLKFSRNFACFETNIEYIEPPASKILLDPKLYLDNQAVLLEEGKFLECVFPGVIHNHVYYRFPIYITRQHLRHLSVLRELTIPEPLFGSFIENSLPQISTFSYIKNKEVLEQFVTLPFVEQLKAICDLSYLDGELEVYVYFQYDEVKIPASKQHLEQVHLESFVTEGGIVARNLVEEKTLLDELFRDFQFNQDSGAFIAKSEKKIIEFMTDTIPNYQHQVTFNCPQNLLDQFIYDNSAFTLKLSHTNKLDQYEIELKVDGHLKGIKMERLWECILSKKAFIELENTRKKKNEVQKLPKILVLDLDKIGALVQFFDELGIEKLDNGKLKRPLWNLANIDKDTFAGLPVTFTMSKKLTEIRQQMLGEKEIEFSPIPQEIQADLRPYQVEGVRWVERIRKMYLNGVLADDMGLGKTLQAIVSITQNHELGKTTLVVCPTSLLYNWKEEINKFNPSLNVCVIDGVPNQRKKTIDQIDQYDVVITSYTLLQKDIELYEPIEFSYMILDEAQHIKNRGTRNAKSVKKIHAQHRLILSGTPIENSLDELWSLFDFLMPGFLGSYDRFVEKYIRVSKNEQSRNLEYLKKKVAPFILRRMKTDVLKDLPPVQELTYHCQLTDEQKQLYQSYAASARDELVKLVERDGFDKVQIHVLATLTRLKQICCHPAIFAKENPELGDSAKYEMLLELLQTLIEGNHKVVIFSQYTKMLQIMKQDFDRRKIQFAYLDGSSKNRLETVKQFNEDPNISVFLVSLKAGGTGLNLVGADTVIHYDMWWNPAIESQATDRVHRMGQDKSVSVYKLVTKNTIEEKIVEMQNRKKGIVKKIVSSDEEALTKLTWEDVLELLQG